MAKAPTKQPAKQTAKAAPAAAPAQNVAAGPATPTYEEPAGRSAGTLPPSPASGGGAGGEGALIPAIRVTAAREGFRRGGRAWSVQPTTVPIAEFTAEQLAQIRGETIMLKVEDVELDLDADAV